MSSYCLRLHSSLMHLCYGHFCISSQCWFWLMSRDIMPNIGLFDTYCSVRWIVDNSNAMMAVAFWTTKKMCELVWVFGIVSIVYLVSNFSIFTNSIKNLEFILNLNLIHFPQTSGFLIILKYLKLPTFFKKPTDKYQFVLQHCLHTSSYVPFHRTFELPTT